MSSISAENRKSLMLFSGRALPRAGRRDRRGARRRADARPTSYEFANGEIFVRFKESVRGSRRLRRAVASPTPVNTWLMETLIMVDALKRGSAKRITVVLPFYPYARQDKKHRGREPISARLVADLFKTAGANRHPDRRPAHRADPGLLRRPGRPPVRAWTCWPSYVQSASTPAATMTVVAPDSGRVRVAERWTDRLGGCPLAFIHKTRDPLKPNQVVANRVVGEVEGRVCLIVDDMIDTGGTICKAAEILFDAGAADVIVAATHGVLSDPATERLKNSQISEVVVTNTLPIAAEKQLRQDHRAVDRPAAGPGDPGGLRRRLGHHACSTALS